MNNDHPKVFLFVHLILSVQDRAALLTRPVRKVLFTALQKEAVEKGINILAVNGVEDHIHCLVQLLPAQNVTQVVNSIRTAASLWLNENKLLAVAFAWEDGYTAYSVSPSSVRQVIDFIGRQEEYHKTKTLDSEMEVFNAKIAI
jgi:putative transposase